MGSFPARHQADLAPAPSHLAPLAFCLRLGSTINTKVQSFILTGGLGGITRWGLAARGFCWEGMSQHSGHRNEKLLITIPELHSHQLFV